MSTEEKETPMPEDDPVEVEEPEAAKPSEEESKDQPIPVKSVGVVLADGKVLEFDPRDFDLAVGDMVVVDNERDLNLGRVVFLTDNRVQKLLRRVIRRVGPEDLLLMRRNKKREEEAFDICQKRIAERHLPMKLIQVAYLHGGNKAIFYFSAEGRVDFRALVRDLAQQLHVRIEMRQIGVRDESKMLGGVGICGQQLCCARFLRKFVPVSIKMAKNQNLALNPQKLSGLCGRLMCCLVFEDDLYKKLRKDMPKVGSTIETPRGEGKVLNTDVLGRRVQVQLEQTTAEFTIEELRGEKAPEPYMPAERAEPIPRPERTDEGDRTREGRRRKRRSRAMQKRSDQQTGPQTEAPKEQPAKSAEPGAAQAQDPAGKKRRKRRSRKRTRRRKKKSPGEGGQAAGPGREGAG